MGNANDLKDMFDILHNAADDIREAIQNGTGSHTTTEYSTSEDGNTKSYTRTTTTTNFSSNSYTTDDDNYVTYEERMKQHEAEKKRKAAAPKVIKVIIGIWIASILLPLGISVITTLVSIPSELKHVMDQISHEVTEPEYSNTEIEDVWDRAEEQFREDYITTEPSTTVAPEKEERAENETNITEEKKLPINFNFEFKSSYIVVAIVALAFGVILVLILRKVTTKKEVIYDGFNYTVKDDVTDTNSNMSTEHSGDNLNDNITDTEDTE